MRCFKADMHIHSCLSPCADWQMSPKRIVHKSHEKGLDIIVISDHNSMENVEAAMIAAKEKDLKVLAGLEICSSEEVHLLGIFDNLDRASAMQDYVYDHLTESNNPDVFGDQWVVNEKDEFIRDNTRLLIGSTQLDVQQIVEKIHSFSGLCIASHVDRPAFGIISQLGFIPPDLALDGIEISRHIPVKKAIETIAGIQGFACVTSSDAHFLNDVGNAYTLFQIEAPTLEEICLALKNEQGRRVIIE